MTTPEHEQEDVNDAADMLDRAEPEDTRATPDELRSEVLSLRLKLGRADVVMEAIDILIARRVISSRDFLADARLDYGPPHEYQYANSKLLRGPDGGRK